jgi:hypothetical protein
MIPAHLSVIRDPYRLTLVLPGLPKTSNAHRSSGHWARYRDDGAWKSAVTALARPRRPKVPLDRYRLHLTRFSSMEPDYDGLVSTWKSVVDGLREAGVIANDRYSNSGPWLCDWEKSSPKSGHIRIVVESISQPEPEIEKGGPHESQEESRKEDRRES